MRHKSNTKFVSRGAVCAQAIVASAAFGSAPAAADESLVV